MTKVREELQASQQDGEEVDILAPLRRTIGQVEHPGRVRGLRLRPTPTKLYGRSYRDEGSSSQGRRRHNYIDEEQMRAQITAELSQHMEHVWKEKELAWKERERAQDLREKAREEEHRRMMQDLLELKQQLQQQTQQKED